MVSFQLPLPRSGFVQPANGADANVLRTSAPLTSALGVAIGAQNRCGRVPTDRLIYSESNQGLSFSSHASRKSENPSMGARNR